MCNSKVNPLSQLRGCSEVLMMSRLPLQPHSRRVPLVLFFSSYGSVMLLLALLDGRAGTSRSIWPHHTVNYCSPVSGSDAARYNRVWRFFNHPTQQCLLKFYRPVIAKVGTSPEVWLGLRPHLVEIHKEGFLCHVSLEEEENSYVPVSPVKA
ncbi:hypothetical protein J6590_017644 [Homalodisca vitripennis]|nr:hypothetical protein J6590_017644 [Homalodisca vitripennis]